MIKTVALLIIGDEILSGFQNDENINFIAKRVQENGLCLKEVRIVSDEEQDIIKAANELRQSYDYLFTTGGIGATHDDITAPAIAKAFHQKVVQNPEVLKIIEDYLGDKACGYYKRLALMPEKISGLIQNSVSQIPSFYIDNVYVMAGMPSVMRAMLASFLPSLTDPSVTYYERVLKTPLQEIDVAKTLDDFQREYEGFVTIGSYPFYKDGDERGVRVVLKSYNQEKIENCFKELDKQINLLKTA